MIEAEAVGDTEAEGEAEGENTRVRLVARLDTEAELPATSVSTRDSTSPPSPISLNQAKESREERGGRDQSEIEGEEWV